MIGDYKIVKTLALTSYSNTYLVEDKVGVIFLLKTIENPTNKVSLQTKIEALKVLSSHNNILSLYKIFKDAKRYFFVYEYVKNGNLYKLGKKEAFSEDDAISFLKQMVETLIFAHSKGYMHFDIKPDNILKKENKYILCDWGLVRKKEDKVLSDIKTNNLYLAPEVFKGYVTTSSDIYSLGACLYHMLTQKRVFNLKFSDKYAYIMYAHCNLPIDLSMISSSKLKYILNSMLEKDDKKRISLEEILYVLNEDEFLISTKVYDVNYDEIKKRSKYSLYNELAGHDIPAALNNLGLLFETDEKIEDMDKAFEFYRKASILGYTKAYYNLALCYYQGKGIEKNEKKAYEYFELSALNNHSKSIHYLAYFHEFGIYVDKSINIALRLYLKAANYGNNKSYEKLKEYSSFKEE